jgi:hypothetical protein
LDHGLANVNRNKSKRRKPWIRFKRKHSLSIVHLDWHTSIHDGKKVFICVVLDDGFSEKLWINLAAWQVLSRC